MNSAARLIKVGIEIGRLAAGLPTATTHNFDFDITQCTDDQLERIANGENPVAVMANTGQGRTGT